jgi:hypothetical protein
MIETGTEMADYSEHDKSYYIEYFITLVVQNAPEYEYFSPFDVAWSVDSSPKMIHIFRDNMDIIKKKILSKRYAIQVAGSHLFELVDGAKEIELANRKSTEDKKIINHILLQIDSDCCSATNFDLRQVGEDLHMDKNEVRNYLIYMESKGLIRFPYPGNNSYCVLTPAGLSKKEFGETIIEKVVPNNITTNVTYNNKGHVVKDSNFYDKTEIFTSKNSPEKEKKSYRREIFIGVLLAIIAAVLNADKIQEYINSLINKF